MTTLLALLCNVLPVYCSRWFSDRVVLRAMDLLLEDYLQAYGQPLLVKVEVK